MLGVPYSRKRQSQEGGGGAAGGGGQRERTRTHSNYLMLLRIVRVDPGGGPRTGTLAWVSRQPRERIETNPHLGRRRVHGRQRCNKGSTDAVHPPHLPTPNHDTHNLHRFRLGILSISRSLRETPGSLALRQPEVENGSFASFRSLLLRGTWVPSGNFVLSRFPSINPTMNSRPRHQRRRHLWVLCGALHSSGA